MKVVEGQRIAGARLDDAVETTVAQDPRERRNPLTTRPP